MPDDTPLPFDLAICSTQETHRDFAGVNRIAAIPYPHAMFEMVVSRAPPATSSEPCITASLR